MNIRKITSLTMLLSFVALVITSIILYVVPQGRVAYWSDWHLWGMTKTEWGNLHINLGLLFLLAGLLHIFYNWSVIIAYLKNRARKIKIFTPSFTAAFSLVVLVGVGTYVEMPPMSSVIQLGDAIKSSGAEKYGEPPYGHAELSSLRLFAKKQDLNLERSIKLLQEAGIEGANGEKTLAAMATANGLSPQQLYAIIKPVAETTASAAKKFPDSPMPGFGNKTLAAICSEYNLMFPVVQRGLARKRVKAEARMTIKEIAAANDIAAMTLFDYIHAIVNEKPDTL